MLQRRGPAGGRPRRDDGAYRPGDAHPVRRLLVASFNPGKARELARLVENLGFTVTTLEEGGIGQAWEETGATYEENARGKALYYAKLSGMITVADDSGIEVEALGGGPGPLSARYGGAGLDDAGRCRLLLSELGDRPDVERRARYVALVAVARPDGAARLFRGECEGLIARGMSGTAGFGYDPLFFYPAFGRTFGEVSEEMKNGVSHRGRALRLLAAFLGSPGGAEFLSGTATRS